VKKTQNNGNYAIQGHLVPIESSDAISY